VPRSRGFEIESELASEAVARRLRTVEVPVPYRPRIAGSSSKLQAFRDGLRIVAMILRQSLRLRPWRPLALLAGAAGALALATGLLTPLCAMLLGLAALVVVRAAGGR
jgi:hypothetical protein